MSRWSKAKERQSAGQLRRDESTSPGKVPLPGKDNDYYLNNFFWRQAAIGGYYHCLDAATFKVLEFTEKLSTHPDSALRRMGVIKQKGKYAGVEVEYSARLKKWIDVSSGMPEDRCKEEYVTQRTDSVPKGVIRVVGDVTFSELLSNSASAHQQRTDQHIVQKLKILHAESIPDNMSEFPEDGGPTLLDYGKDARRQGLDSGYQKLIEPEVPKEVGEQPEMQKLQDRLSLMKQYLGRSVPEAAKKIGALIVHNGHGDVADELAKGVAFFRADRPGTHGMADRRPEVKLMGVHSETVHWEDMNPNFDIHVKLQQPEKERTSPTSFILMEEPGQDRVCEGCRISFRPNVHIKPTSKKMVLCDECKVLKWTREMVAEIATGYLPRDQRRNTQQTQKKRKEETRDPPFRPTVPVVTIVAGGHPERCKADVMQSVRNQWPILVIAGSGGYADVITNLIARVKDLAPNAGTDEFRSHLGAVDAQTAEIINEGKIFVIEEPMVPEGLTRAIESSIKGDETLEKAWYKYATWSSNALEQQYKFKMMQLLILQVGLVTTVLSIVQTVIVLRTAVAGADGSSSLITFASTLIAFIVIGLPIAISVLQGVSVEKNFGAKWVSLRWAAETILSEIYFYRTHTGAYAPVALRDNDEQVSTREELLHVRMASITDQLADSEIAEMTLTKWNDPVPPPSVRKLGDDGMSDLSPDAYVDFRVKRKMELYNRDVLEIGKTLRNMSILSYCLGALGTVLAVLAVQPTLSQWNLQAWVAVTTALVNALTRYADYSRYEWLHKKYNTCAQKLNKMESWWSSRGQEADTLQYRNQLTEGTEAIIAEEVQQWEKQLKNALAKLKKDQEKEKQEREDILRALRNGEDLDKVKRMRDLGLDELSPETIQQALSNPTGPAADQMRNVLAKLNDELGDPVGKAVTAVKESETFQKLEDKVEEVVEQSGVTDLVSKGAAAATSLIATALNDIDMGIEEIIPDFVHRFVTDEDSRAKFMQDVMGGRFDPRTLTVTDIEQMVQKASSVLASKVKSITPRQLLIIAKQMSLEQLTSDFCEELALIEISLVDLLPSKSLADARSNALNSLVMEFTNLASLPWKELSVAEILTIVKDDHIRMKLEKLSEAQVRAILKRADRFLSEDHPVPLMFERTASTIADLDLEVLLSDPKMQVAGVETVEKVRKLPFRLSLLNKDEVLGMFVPELRKELAHCSHGKLVLLLRKLALGTADSTVFRAFYKSKPQPECLKQQPMLESVFRDPQNQERIVMMVRALDQMSINQLHKSEIIKKLAISSVCTQEVTDALRTSSEDALRELLSGIKGRLGNQYSSRVFDRVADEITSFDIRILFNGAERLTLVWSCTDLKDLNLLKMSKEAILRSFASGKLVQKLQQLQWDQLRDLLCRMQWVMANTFHFRLFRKALNSLRLEVPDQFDALLQANVFLIDRIVNVIVRSAVMPKPGTDDKFNATAFLKKIEDRWVRQSLASLSPGSLERFCCKIQSFYGCHVVGAIFENAGRNVSSEEANAKYNGMFALPRYRNAMIVALIPLLENDPSPDNPDGQNVAYHHHLQHLDIDRLRAIMVEESEQGEYKDDVARVIDELLLLFGERNFRMIVSLLTQELILTLGYQLFMQACNEIPEFDLREVITEYSERQLVAPLIWLLWTKASIILENDTNELLSTRYQILSACDLEEEIFDSVTDRLRVLSETQLKLVVTRILGKLNNGVAGQFFIKFMGQNAAIADQPLSTRLAELQALNMLRTKSKLYPEAVKRDFNDFEANSFSIKLEEDKKRILTRHLQSDSLVKTIARFDHHRIRMFFNSLKGLPIYGAQQEDSNGEETHYQRMQRLQYEADMEDDEDEKMDDFSMVA